MTDDPHPPQTLEEAKAEIEYLAEMYRHYKALAEACKRRLDALKASEADRAKRDIENHYQV